LGSVELRWTAGGRPFLEPALKQSQSRSACFFPVTRHAKHAVQDYKANPGNRQFPPRAASILQHRPRSALFPLARMSDEEPLDEEPRPDHLCSSRSFPLLRAVVGWGRKDSAETRASATTDRPRPRFRRDRGCWGACRNRLSLLAKATQAGRRRRGRVHVRRTLRLGGQRRSRKGTGVDRRILKCACPCLFSRFCAARRLSPKTAGSAALLGSNVRTRIFGSTRSTFLLAPDVATRRRGIRATLDRSEREFPAERWLQNMSYAHGRMADDGALAC